MDTKKELCNKRATLLITPQAVLPSSDKAVMQPASFPSNKMAYLCWENKLNWKQTEMNNKKFPGHNFC